MKLLVTGGAGFIGSNFVRRRIQSHPDNSVRVLDKLTYAGRRENLEGIERVELVVGDICDRDAARAAVEGCDAIVNFAAESHVDRSIDSPDEFIETDVHGTLILLEAARDAGIRHLQISTDEVYGSIDEGSFTESSPLNPSSPYSASKAGGDLIVSAFNHTYGAESLVIRASNNYGPRQHPEKLIPLTILNLMAGDPVPVYGDGAQVRNWLFVEDFASAIDAVLENGVPGEAYNVGGPDEIANIEVVRRVLELTGRDESLIEYVKDRPGHDRRYSLASTKLEGLGWKAAVSFDEGIERTVAWYRRSEEWWSPLRSGEYREYYERQYGKSLSLMARTIETKLEGLVAIEPEVFGDERGFLVETFSADAWRELGVDVDFVQHNHSRSARNTLRGLHFQTSPGQAKLVRCSAGKIFDVAVDLRRDSPTFGQWEGHELDDRAHRQLLVPIGFGHGFCVLSESADVDYQLSSYYDPDTEAGIAWDDPDVGVEWPVSEPLLSERDTTAPKLADVRDELPF